MKFVISSAYLFIVWCIELKNCYFRIERCSFSWDKIYPGHGCRFVRGDSRVFIFSSSKTRSCFNIKRSSRNTKWTGDWRKAHKKDIATTTKRRVKKRTTRFFKDYVGLTLEELRNKRRTKVVAEKPKGADAAALKYEILFTVHIFYFTI